MSSPNFAYFSVDMLDPSSYTDSVASKRKRKNKAAVMLGKLGGKKGGPARAKALSPERRRAIARKAALTRWARQKESG